MKTHSHNTEYVYCKRVRKPATVQLQFMLYCSNFQVWTWQMYCEWGLEWSNSTWKFVAK